MSAAKQSIEVRRRSRLESRTRSFDQGILALRSVLAREHGNLEAICDALITSLAERCEDDITVILARIPPDRRS